MWQYAKFMFELWFWFFVNFWTMCSRGTPVLVSNYSCYSQVISLYLEHLCKWQLQHVSKLSVFNLRASLYSKWNSAETLQNYLKAVKGISKSKLDKCILISEIYIDNYDTICCDQNRYAREVVCYKTKNVNYVIFFFSTVIELLLVNTKPIVVRPFINLQINQICWK